MQPGKICRHIIQSLKISNLYDTTAQLKVTCVILHHGIAFLIALNSATIWFETLGSLFEMNQNNNYAKDG